VDIHGWADRRFRRRSRRGLGSALVCLAAAGLSLLALGSVGCDLDRNEGVLMPAGSFGDLAVVVSDGDLLPGVRTFLSRLNAPLEFVIRQEPRFAVDVFGPDKWKLGRNYRNILYVVRFGDGGPVQHEAERLLHQETLARMRQGGVVARFPEPYGRYQLAIFAGARDRNELFSLLNRSAEELRQSLEKSITERLQARFEHEGIPEDRVEELWRRFGFFLRLPASYRTNQVEPEGFSGVEWLRTGPSRGITMAWEPAPTGEAALADRQGLLDLRRRMGRIVHQEDVLEQGLSWSDTVLAGRPAVALEGAWAGRDFDGGGPFRCFFLTDPGGTRVFCLDLLVFAPGQDKLPYFRELQAIAWTLSFSPPSG
jgi:hypothetical protein